MHPDFESGFGMGREQTATQPFRFSHPEEPLLFPKVADEISAP